MASSVITNSGTIVRTRDDWNEGQRVRRISVNWSQALGMHLVIEVVDGTTYYVKITTL